MMQATDQPCYSIADAVELVDRGTDCPILLLCEHASKAVPREWQRLGLSAEQISGHIGWDIGAAEITRALSKRLGATAVLSRFSRLFIDCNRFPEQENAIPAISDGVEIPANAAISADERRLRMNISFRPFHGQVKAMTDRHLAAGVAPVIVAIHSFTPVMNGLRRPWGIGVLWNECDALAGIISQKLEEQLVDNDLEIGANEPYSAKEFLTYSLEIHGRQRGLQNLAFEIRNDLAGDERGRNRIVALLEEALHAVMDMRQAPAS